MRKAALFGIGLGLLPALPVAAQALGPAEIASCLCLRRTVDALSADMAARQQALADIRAELDRATAGLEAARNSTDVNDPAAVARFRQMLEQRDALFRRANGDAVTEAGAAVAQYNQRSEEYNARCASRPMDPGLLQRVQATLVCPGP
jgi:multidrug resistance efflux pump